MSLTIEEMQTRVTSHQQVVLGLERRIAQTEAVMSETERQIALCEQQAKQLGVETLDDLDTVITRLSRELENDLSSSQVQVS